MIQQKHPLLLWTKPEQPNDKHWVKLHVYPQSQQQQSTYIYSNIEQCTGDFTPAQSFPLCLLRSEYECQWENEIECVYLYFASNVRGNNLSNINHFRTYCFSHKSYRSPFYFANSCKWMTKLRLTTELSLYVIYMRWNI